MIALYGLPGAGTFAYRRVATRAEGEAWLDEQVSPETQESLGARRQSRVISEREASRLRWRDGRKIVTPRGLAEAQVFEQDAAQLVHATCLLCGHESAETMRADASLSWWCGTCRICDHCGASERVDVACRRCGGAP